MTSVLKDDIYILNYCSKCIPRSSGKISDAWRFPIVDTFFDPLDQSHSYNYDSVTFVYLSACPDSDLIEIVGDFGNCFEPLRLRRIQETPYFTTTLRVKRNSVHIYKYRTNGIFELDAINPQRITDANGVEWSRFFTTTCLRRLTLTRREYEVLDALVSYICPFRTIEAQLVLSPSQRMYKSVGATNYIDKVLTKEERHRLSDYRTCLDLIDGILTQRFKTYDISIIPAVWIGQVLDDMAKNSVSGWDYNRYPAPEQFLRLLRRHAFSGAFSHPKYGGNIAAAAWSFLEERYRDWNGKTLFDWRRSIEFPLGKDKDYHG